MTQLPELALTVEARDMGIAAARDFVERACRGAGMPEPALFDLLVALEEVCTNIVVHGYAGATPGPMQIALALEPDRATLTVSDRARPFDPADAPLPDLTSDLDKRPVGGLGWHLVRHLTDEMRYTREPDGNRVTLVKHFKTRKGTS